MNAIELRENLRALAATILHIVQYETTEAEVLAALKENRRLADELEKTLDFDRLCAETDRKILDDLMAKSKAYDLTKDQQVWLKHQAEERPAERVIKSTMRNDHISFDYSPARSAMADIVKDHLMPPAPFIDRGIAEE